MISGQTIKETRVQKLVPQHALAKQLGTTQQRIAYLEKCAWVSNGNKILEAINEVEKKGLISFRLQKEKI